MNLVKDYHCLLLQCCVVLLPLLGFVLGSTNCAATCHCSISENSEEKGVIHVRPNCTEGKFTWLHPYNAIRLRLNPLTDGEEFETCVKIQTNYLTVKVYEETMEDLKALFVVPGGEEREYCRSRNNSPTTFFIEHERTYDYPGPPKIVIYYERIELANHLNPMRDCRPCDESELLRLYCTSDLILQGVMGPKTTSSEIEIYISKHIFGDKRLFYHPSSRGPVTTTTVVPEKCRIQRGNGNFLFLARKRFDKVHILCAPYLSNWEKIRKKALQAGNMQCSYD